MCEEKKCKHYAQKSCPKRLIYVSCNKEQEDMCNVNCEHYSKKADKLKQADELRKEFCVGKPFEVEGFNEYLESFNKGLELVIYMDFLESHITDIEAEHKKEIKQIKDGIGNYVSQLNNLFGPDGLIRVDNVIVAMDNLLKSMEVV